MTRSEQQRNRNQRGEDFQNEIRRSWPLVPNSWRLRIADAGGGSRPADEITLLPGCNILAEMKRTEKPYFGLDFLRPNQVRGLLDFDRVLDRNYGLVYVSFLAEKGGWDLAYAFRLRTGIAFMRKHGIHSIPLASFIDETIQAIELPRLTINGEPGYDLGGLTECYRLL